MAKAAIKIGGVVYKSRRGETGDELAQRLMRERILRFPSPTAVSGMVDKNGNFTPTVKESKEDKK
jgi:hypothetical protein